MGLFRRKKDDGDDRPVDLDERSPQTGVRYKDLLVMNELREAGADLTQPRQARWFLHFPTEAAAIEASDIAHQIRFTAEVMVPTPTDDGRWSLVLEADDVVVDFEAMKDADDFLTSLTADLGGEYDGWEAAV